MTWGEEKRWKLLPNAAIDLFCGIGGLTKGLSLAEIDVIAGFDNDSSCRFAYEENNDAVFYGWICSGQIKRIFQCLF